MALTIVTKKQPVPVEPEAEKPAETLPWEEPKAVEPEATPEPSEAPSTPKLTQPLAEATGALSEAQWQLFKGGSEQTPENNIQLALACLAAQEEKSVLMLMRRATGESFQVLQHDPDTGETKLLDVDNERTFSIRLRDQENRFYSPLWR